MVIFVVGAILLSCSSVCLADEIKPPTDEQVEEMLKEELGKDYPDNVKFIKKEKMHTTNSSVSEYGVEYWLFVIFEQEVEGSDYGRIFYLYASWQNSSDDEPITQLSRALTQGGFKEENDGFIKETEEEFKGIAEDYDLKPGWPTLNAEGKVVEPGEETGPAGEIGTSQPTSDGSKIPGPGSWWQWLTGTVIAGIIAAIIGLINAIFGGTSPAAPPLTPVVTPEGPDDLEPPEEEIEGGTVDPLAPPKDPARKKKRRRHLPPLVYPPTVEPPPSIGPAKPFLDESGKLIYPPGTEPPPSLEQARPYSETPGGGIHFPTPDLPPSGIWDYADAAGKTLWDTGAIFGKGTADFFKGTLNTILTGYKELGLLGIELTDSKAPSLLGELLNSPSILLNTPLNIAKEMLESINPTEELESLKDPNMSMEGKLWAASSIALKMANALLMKETLKDMKNYVKGKLANEPVVPKPTEPAPPGPGTRQPKNTAGRAVDQAKKTVSKESAREYRTLRDEVKQKVDRFAEKVKSGEPITTEDVLDVTNDPAATREVLGKTGREIPPEVKEAVHRARRNIYDGTDQQVAEELAAGQPEIQRRAGSLLREVSTGGRSRRGEEHRPGRPVRPRAGRGGQRTGKVTTVREPVATEGREENP